MGTSRVISLLTGLVLLSAARAAVAETKLSAAEQKFADQMENVVLVGSFTIVGRNNENLRPERYEVESAKKIGKDTWVITARIKYGKNDVKFPVPVKVYWADDTPMISLTDLTIPGLGDGFTTRVLFYGDRYAGTWQHGKVGGHFFGQIEKAKQDKSEGKGSAAKDEPSGR